MSRILNAPKFKENPNIIRSPSIPNRHPLFTLVHGDSGLYFVNEGSETLPSISSKPWGFSGELTLQEGEMFSYTDVQPGEGVLIQREMTKEEAEDFDFYGQEFYIGTYLYLESERFGKIRITPDSRHRVDEQVLIYTSGGSPSRVMVTSMEDNNARTYPPSISSKTL